MNGSARDVVRVLQALGVVSPQYSEPVRKAALMGSGGDSQLVKFERVQSLMKSVEPPVVISMTEPDRIREPAAHELYTEKCQQAAFAHFVKALHMRGPDESWNPRTFGGYAAYRHHG